MPRNPYTLIGPYSNLFDMSFRATKYGGKDVYVTLTVRPKILAAVINSSQQQKWL